MDSLSFRQVHIDFHNSEHIPDIGRYFNKEQFQCALRAGCVNSVTVFSKCHHGWSYHPTVAGAMHPNLSFDLTGEMIDAAHEIGVQAVIYLSAGFDERLVRKNSAIAMRNKEQSQPNFMQAGYNGVCLNGEYLNILLSQIKEVLLKYKVEGLFLDIVGVRKCYCVNCIDDLVREGRNPHNDEDVLWLAQNVHEKYTTAVKNLVDEVQPGIRIFHNGGHIAHGRRDLAAINTHLELESLPTGGWGYDHFPLSARYAQGLDMEFLGMTGKFHLSWGEFGGYKHPNALRYETALSLANGAKCSIGDQMHPDGEMDTTTYNLIGEAYREVMQNEEWCCDVHSIADIGVLSVESVARSAQWGEHGGMYADKGAVRILLEGGYLFDIIDQASCFEKYKLLLLPDEIRADEALAKKLNIFTDNGGKIIASGVSGLKQNANEFAIDLGVKYISENENCPSYFEPQFNLESLGAAHFVMYEKSHLCELTHAKSICEILNSYFNRDLRHFCSHHHSPCEKKHIGTAMAKTDKSVYIALNIFTEYAKHGSITSKQLVTAALDMLLEDGKSFTASLPSQGVTTFMYQKKQNRYVAHLLYASPVKRGEGVEVIEDILSLYNIECTMRLSSNPKALYLAPQNEEIKFEYNNDVASFIVPCLNCHQMVVAQL